jgi:uncharacterized protein involved in type VI secretion and phage assembly
VAMVVRAYDKTHRMMRGRKQQSFVDSKTSDIISKVCSANGIHAEVQDSVDVHKFVLQHNETDFDFVSRLGKRIGFELSVDMGKAKFGPPNGDGEKVELSYPDDLRAFRPRITAVQQVQKVNVRGFDFSSKRSVVRTANSPQQVTEAGITRSSVASKFPAVELEIAGQSFTASGEADKMAQSALNQLANAYLAAEGTCDGDPRIKAGVLLNIKGVGKNYSGTYRVAKSVHVIRGGGGYETHWSNSPGEHSLLGQASGNGSGSGGGLTMNSIVIGIVTNNKDPEETGRVRLKLPSLSDMETFWAPVSVMAGGKGRGLSMLPVPGEQVLVAFENGDPSYPYVIGSLFNGKDKPGEELAFTDGSFALRSDHKALLHTKEDMTLHIDKGKLDIQVDNGDITETVKGQGGGYTGDFAGAYKLKATQAVTIESSQSVTIKAPSITVDASASLALKGAMIDIKASGIVTIAGSMINIG